jgi:hypothetical protein
VPLAFLASGTDARVWFLALYMPDGWRVVVAVAMMLIGVGALAYAARAYPRHAQR